MGYTGRYRSLYWPVILIGVGVIWLLANLGMIPAGSLVLLFRMWPLILILLGLDILLGRRSQWVGALIALLVVGLAAALLVAAPSLGLSREAEVRISRLEAPLEDAVSATIFLDLSSSPVVIGSLDDSPNLIEASLIHVGEVDFRVRGEDQKHIRLGVDESQFLRYLPLPSRRLHWDIALSPEVPLELAIDGGSGRSQVDLRGLQIASLNADMGSGASQFVLPATMQSYQVQIDGGSGRIEITILSGAQVELRLDGGSGNIVVNLPQDAPIRFEVLDRGSGRVNVPSQLIQVSEGLLQDAVWETPDYHAAERKITIIVTNVGAGNISLR